MTDDPRMDFRYRDEAGVELEAYQITKASRWDTAHWPAWLQTQSSARDVNKVYTDAADPTHLFISLDSGRFAIEDDAYVIFENGTLRVENGVNFDGRYNKVVPIPPRQLDEESLPGFERTHRVEDGKLVKLSDEEVAELPPEITMSAIDEYVPGKIITELPSSDLRPKAEIVLEMLQEGQTDAALSTLKNALSDETVWCSCAPGQCCGGPRWGCREQSPLVK